MTNQKLLTFTRIRECIPGVEVSVSTVYLEIPNADGTRYETIVFDEAGRTIDEERYSLPEEALLGHLRHTFKQKEQTVSKRFGLCSLFRSRFI